MDLTLNFKKGIKDGIPIAIGYLAVAFAFGVSVVSQGLPALVAIIISATNMTSAGQVAGSAVMLVFGSLIEIALTQVVINARYFLMGVTLSQRFNKDLKIKERFLIAFGITDEVFGVAVTKKQLLGSSYMYGLILLPWLGWTAGTVFGAVLGEVMPQILLSSFSIAIYGMFIAIVVPAGVGDKRIFIVALLSVALSCLFYYIPYLKTHISSGMTYIICALVSSIVCALIFPIKEGAEVEDA